MNYMKFVAKNLRKLDDTTLIIKTNSYDLHGFGPISISTSIKLITLSYSKLSQQSQMINKVWNK